MKLQPDTRYLIIHADDGGVCHSVNRAIIEALEGGIATSTSLMVPCPQFVEIARFFQQNPQYDVGIHLTLTCEYPHYPWAPIADPQKVASLINAKGYLRTQNEFITHATPEAVETELRAQIDRFLEFGIQPTHMDTHQATLFLNMNFLEIYIKLGQEYRIPPMLLKLNEQTFEMIDIHGLEFDMEVLDQWMALDLPLLDFLFVATDNNSSLEQREREYIDVIKGSPPGLSQIVIHPGFDDEELKGITGNSSHRYYDFSIFTNSNMKKIIDDNRIELIGWKDLAMNS
jgi:predicted glycoside hydrolase/deacetylase ChbG (UPF0249 family)